LVNELANAKLSAKHYMQEKERKTGELIEEACNELPKETAEDKDEVEAFLERVHETPKWKRKGRR